MPPKEKYTDPELREQVKEEIQASDKGGAPGQWSARKAQMMASEYKKRGGRYTTTKDKKDESQRHLDQWTEEDWQTKDGSGTAKNEDGTRSRYLPKKTWDRLTEKEKEETEKEKLEQSGQGKQFVENPPAAKKAGKEIRERDQKLPPKKKTQSKRSKETPSSDASSAKDSKVDEVGASDDGGTPDSPSNAKKVGQTTGEPASRKRTRDKQPAQSSNKKQKDNSGRGRKPAADRTAPGQPGSKDRVPKKGQTVHWKALPGYVEGCVVEVAYAQKDVEGKKVKGSKEDPRIVLKSSSSGKIAVHKPEAVFF